MKKLLWILLLSLPCILYAAIIEVPEGGSRMNVMILGGGTPATTTAASGCTQEASDDFSSDTITSGDWDEVTDDWEVSGGSCGITSTNGNALLQYDAEEMDTLYHYIKVKVATLPAAAVYDGLSLRATSTDSDDRYVIRWDSTATDLQFRVCAGASPSCSTFHEQNVGSAYITAGDYIGASVSGTGTSTELKFWQWDSDPTGDPDDWGAADYCVNNGGTGGCVDWCQSALPGCTGSGGDPSTYCDTGKFVGFYLGSGTESNTFDFDNFVAGSCN